MADEDGQDLVDGVFNREDVERWKREWAERFPGEVRAAIELADEVFGG